MEESSLTEVLKKKEVFFPKRPEKDFLAAAKTRVMEAFVEKGISPYANGEMWTKLFCVFFCWGFSLVAIYGEFFGGGGTLLLYAFLGFVSTFNGLNLAHDCNHFSFSVKRWVNLLFASFFDLNGTSSVIWRHSHNEGHHIYTNIPGKDLDVDKAPPLRLSPGDKRAWFHRYQHLYAPLLYCISTMNWVFYSDYLCYFQMRRDKTIKTGESILFWAFKGSNILLLLFLPVLLTGLSFWIYLLGLLLLHMVAGLTSALVFQMGHVVEGVEYVIPNKEGNLPYDWAEHEMRTTSNFSVGDRFVTFWVGGLNYQIEHHLFPHICHTHYHWIAPLVRELAAEYNIPYHQIPTFRESLASHFRLLKRLGNKTQWNYAKASHFRSGS